MIIIIHIMTYMQSCMCSFYPHAHDSPVAMRNIPGPVDDTIQDPSHAVSRKAPDPAYEGLSTYRRAEPAGNVNNNN